MTAELRSQLTEAQLDPEAMGEEIATAHDRMTEVDGFILFGNQLYKPAFFHRQIGLDLSTGAIHLGGVQLENPTVRRFTRGWSPQNTTPSFDASSLQNAPPVFELERLFVGDLGRFELVRMFADGVQMNGMDMEVEDRAELEKWCDAYQEAVKGAFIGRPVLESDYAHRFSGRELRRMDGNLFYGPRLFQALSGIDKDELLDKYIQE